MEFKKVVVIGSGTMGSGIAAQVANVGIPVYLLDINKEISKNACERIKKSRPPLLMNNNFLVNFECNFVNNSHYHSFFAVNLDCYLTALVNNASFHNFVEKSKS